MSISDEHVKRELVNIQKALKNSKIPNILISHGKSQAAYQKTSALQVKLLQYEFPDTVIFISHSDVRIFASSKKCKLLEEFGSCTIREKDCSNISEFLDNLPNDIGILAEPTDDLIVEKVKSWLATKSVIDMHDFVSKYLSVKNESEIQHVAKACSDVDEAIKLTKNVLSDLKRKITHMQLARLIEKQFPNTEFCYMPIVQTAEYNLKPSAVSNTSFLDQEYPVVLQLGIRHQAYCTNIARTFLPAPTQQQSTMYAILIELFEYALSNIVPGNTCSSVYTKFVAYIRQKYEYLESNILKSLGFLLGIEFRDKNYQLRSDCESVIVENMVFTITMGLNNLQDKEMRYSLYLADTILVEHSSSRRLTSLPFDLSFVTLEMTRQDLEVGALNGTRKRTRYGGVQEDDLSKQQERRIHQKELYAKVQDRGVKRYAKSDGTAEQENEFKVKKFDAYRKDYQLPRETVKHKIMVDVRNECILLPICGQVVPFHITTLKNLSKNDESEYVYLRFNFITPGTVAKKDQVPYDDPNATFVRSLTFRSNDAVRFNSIYKEISDLKRAVGKKEAEMKDRADLVEQDKLIEVKGRRPLSLRDVMCRPKTEGKQVASPLEIHTNGLKYRNHLRSDIRVDILFNNIEMIFFQPCDYENYVILHIYLKNSILINKKKTVHVQFYRESTDGNDETQLRRRGMYQEDEFEEEANEKLRRNKLNKEFKQFGEKIVESSGNHVEIDVPYRDLGFHGVPFRTNVLLQPTSDYLVHLTDPPFLVIPINKVEIVHLERIQFGLKAFDMVVIYRDFNTPITQITSIPTNELEGVREWLEYSIFNLALVI
eukprot:NODE_330_length_10876_cov_0.359840.p1 type:complete len:826 gc:universal NODE_330_length_10876_cov_0.359840:5183-7660(+)